jgi:hypothetical protein
MSNRLLLSVSTFTSLANVYRKKWQPGGMIPRRKSHRFDYDVVDFSTKHPNYRFQTGKPTVRMSCFTSRTRQQHTNSARRYFNPRKLPEYFDFPSVPDVSLSDSIPIRSDITPKLIVWSAGTAFEKKM